MYALKYVFYFVSTKVTDTSISQTSTSQERQNESAPSNKLTRTDRHTKKHKQQKKSIHSIIHGTHGSPTAAHAVQQQPRPDAR